MFFRPTDSNYSAERFAFSRVDNCASVEPMPSPDLLDRIAAGKHAVMAQTHLLHREFGRAESKWKSDGTRVTAVDVAISEGIVRELTGQFPDDQYFSEELADTTDPISVRSRFCWVLDPIDGTNNFALGIPHCAISLGLFENGEPVYGIVYDLSRRTLIFGGPGFGAWEGEKALRVSAAPITKESLIGFHSPFDKTLMPLATGVISNFKIRGLGTATLHLAYVASGILEGCVDYNVKIWDLAAAIPIVRAAGGEVRFMNGEQLPLKIFDLKMKKIVYCAGSPEMCARLAGLMKM
jgi:myo-inositol-1(or 4)-monophosphatase